LNQGFRNKNPILRLVFGGGKKNPMLKSLNRDLFVLKISKVF
jgi:hypothetical protein